MLTFSASRCSVLGIARIAPFGAHQAVSGSVVWQHVMCRGWRDHGRWLLCRLGYSPDSAVWRSSSRQRERRVAARDVSRVARPILEEAPAVEPVGAAHGNDPVAVPLGAVGEVGAKATNAHVILEEAPAVEPVGAAHGNDPVAVPLGAVGEVGAKTGESHAGSGCPARHRSSGRGMRAVSRGHMQATMRRPRRRTGESHAGSGCPARHRSSGRGMRAVSRGHMQATMPGSTVVLTYRRAISHC